MPVKQVQSADKAGNLGGLKQNLHQKSPQS